MPGLDTPDHDASTIRDMIEREHADPAYQQMMAAIGERTARLRRQYDGVDVTTLDEEGWREWLTAHHYAERDQAKSRRAQHRNTVKLAARAAGQPWKPNDRRALGLPGSLDPA